MLPFVFWRTLASIPVVALVALLVFSMLYLTPGDPATMLAGEAASDADIERIREALGLNKGFIERFSIWALALIQGDFGSSIYTKIPVLQTILSRLEPTLSLMALTCVIAVTVAIPLGVLAAWKRGSALDAAVIGGAVLGTSVPVFVMGYLLAYLFSVRLGWFPVQGYNPIASGFSKWVMSILLPSFVLSLGFIASIARITRATMLEVLSQDYVRTARAKGLSERAVLFVHSLRNAAVPIATVVGQGVVMLIGGAVVTETVFNIPGIGRLTADAIFQRDYPIIQGIVLLFSFAYVFVNILIDVFYAAMDPQMRR
ncbi:ABC transporter permease [Devosia sp. MC532]|uniref:ABC transporter permease n=1 Tax=Devosia sp. MC532 TaxID=2799788 RepID=UPI0018F659E8|nr:ABC transporter permease [Devosia sp. MC532]MBJ7577885.1 ABC transporter permease [Devosia sp. MC532]